MFTMPVQAQSWWSRSRSLTAKRVIDVVGAIAILGVASPLIATTSLGLRLGGSVLFSQQRPGYRGRVFTIRKFRTMREPRDGESRYRTDAARVTRLGAFLRKTSIDELPELWNVLTGEMSLVGPRPLLIEYLDKYTEHENRRHQMPPGITGWAQVNGRQNIAFSERLRLDVWYVDHWSLLLDLEVIWKTFAAVVVDSHETVGSEGLDVVDDIGLSADRERKGEA